MRPTAVIMATTMIIAAESLTCLPAAETPCLLFEVRRAQREPADGLLKAEVPGSKRQVIYLYPSSELSNADVDEATAGKTEFGQVAIDIIFTEAGARKFSELSAAHRNHPVAFLIDGKVVCAPVIQSRLGKQAQIFGEFTEAEAERIAAGILSRPSP